MNDAKDIKELKLSDFKYVDVWHSDENGVNSPWKRIEVTEIPKFQQDEAFNFSCFSSVQLFSNKKKTKGEAMYAPLYFDLDYELDLSIAQNETVKIIDFFMKELDLQETDIQIYFSGSKGFHTLINAQALGIQPRNDLQKVYKYIAGYLKYRLGDTVTDETGHEGVEPLKTIDPVVYTCPRMLRLPNSMHQKTKLFKIELTLEELKTLTIDQIRKAATQPRRTVGFTNEERQKNLKLRTNATYFYSDKLDEYEKAAATSKDRQNNKEVYLFTKDKMPVCVEDIYTNGWKQDGQRNAATVQLACYFKNAGYTKDETFAKLEEWVKKFTSAKSGYSVRQRIANTRNVIESIFSQENEYKFGCAFIRSLHGEKQPGSKEYDRVACAGELCYCLKKNNDVEEDPISLPLSQTGNASLTGKLIKTKVMVAGKKHTPYIVPKKIEYSCWGRAGCKKYSCPLFNIPTGIAYRELGSFDRELIQMTGIGDDNIKCIIKTMSAVPNCAKFDTNIISTTNVDEILVIPMAQADRVDSDNPESGGKYVVRRVYAVGGLQVNENKYYEISGYVFAHPKDQTGTIIVKSAEPLQDVVEAFILTDEIKEQVKIFQLENYTPEAINEKLTGIMNDLTYNVTHIVERDEVLLGVLLTYHSVLRFTVPWDIQPIRGWIELKIVGDTGTGKSALIEKVQQFTGLGTRVNAESTSRTGLTYKMEQSGQGGSWYIVWGAWPLSDKELIWVDEDTGINKDDWGEMTMARSEGKLEVKRAVTAETPCRVRAILSGNVPNGKRLAEYSQGVECLKDIFNNEDIRRFDFAIFMRATDVAPALYNQKLPEYPRMITPEAMKNNILYAWSRQPEEVVFADNSIETILNVSTDLSKVYGGATDVPIVSPSDQRNKVARLSVALAALTHSVDKSGLKLVVHQGHVKYIYEYLKAVYNAPGAALNYYAKLSVKEEEMDEERYKKITESIRKIDTLKANNKYMEFITLFAQQKYLRLGDVEAMLSIDKEESKNIVNLLAKLRMLVMTSAGYKKTSRFNSFIAKCFEKGLFDQIDFDI